MSETPSSSFPMSPERREELESKLNALVANMQPELDLALMADPDNRLPGGSDVDLDDMTGAFDDEEKMKKTYDFVQHIFRSGKGSDEK